MLSCAYTGLPAARFTADHPGIASTVAFGLQAGCPVIGTPVEGLEATWGQPRIVVRSAEPGVDSLVWEREGLKFAMLVADGVARSIGVDIAGNARVLAGRTKSRPARAYLAEHSDADPWIAYAIAAGCPAVGMDTTQLEAALSNYPRLSPPKYEDGIARYRVGLENQNLVVVFDSAWKITRWEFCAGQGRPLGRPPSVCQEAIPRS